MAGSVAFSSFAWGLLAAYLVIAGVVVFETDFRAPRNSAAGHVIVCLVALVFAAAWPIRALQRFAGRER